ncbi:MAG: hypothetical protein GYB65_02025 [Chloroflexi bacterium]|nr:hypothetical protein [Chloroflexota bacterium]
MTGQRRVLWPLIIVGVGCIWLLAVAGAFPDVVHDLLLRAWPVLIVLFGFDTLVGRRRVTVLRRSIPLNLVGAGGAVILLAVVIWLAYENQGDKLRDDNVVTLERTLDPAIEQVRLDIDVRRTTVTINPSTNGPRTLRAEFRGSEESEVAIAVEAESDSTILTLVVTEDYTSTIPRLEDIGRSTLIIELPITVPIQELVLANAEGDVTLNFSQPGDVGWQPGQTRLYPQPASVLVDLAGLYRQSYVLRAMQIGSVAMSVGNGDLVFRLPDRFGPEDSLTGTLQVNGGGITLDVPADVALNVSLADSGEPRYEYPDEYELLFDGTLKRKNTDRFRVSFTVTVDGGAPLVVNHK